MDKAISFFFECFPLAESTPEQVVKVENLRPSTDYHLIIVAESRAGIGEQTGPIQFRTLDKQIPDFLVEDYQNKTCLNDDSCLITWNIASDGGAPIFRAEILYAQVVNSFFSIKPTKSFFLDFRQKMRMV